MAMARASRPVSLTNSTAWSGAVRWLRPSRPVPWPSSIPPRQPISPSTVIPLACAISTTWRVASTLYSKLEGVFPSAISEPSIFNTAQTTDLAFYGDSLGMRHLDNLAGRIHVVLEAGGGLSIRHQRTVHHDAGEAHLDGALAGLDAVAMVEVQYRGNLGVEFRGGQHQVIEEPVLRIGARAAAGLNDDRGPGFAGRLHDRLNLFHIVDVERANTVTALGRFIE